MTDQRPGWYTDPRDDRQLRFWDGKAWTSNTKFPARDEVAAVPDSAAAALFRPQGEVKTITESPRLKAPQAGADLAQTTIRVAPAASRQPVRPLAGQPALAAMGPLGTAGAGTHFVSVAPVGPTVGEDLTAYRKATMFRSNKLAFAAVAVSAAYFAVAETSSLVILGILPLALAERSFRSRERLAPAGIAAAAVAVAFALYSLAT